MFKFFSSWRFRKFVGAFMTALPSKRPISAMADLTGSRVANCRSIAGPRTVPNRAVSHPVDATTVFCDLSDFVLRSRAFPRLENRINWTNAFYGRPDERRARLGGTSDKVVGDCYMAVFATELGCDEPRRRALEFAVEAVSDDPSGSYAHVGLASGQILLYLAGPAVAMSPTVTGDSVNLAARLAGVEDHRRYAGTSIALPDDLASEILA